MKTLATLRGPGTFKRIFASSRRFDGALIRFHYCLKPGTPAVPVVAIGFSTSARVFKAVERNYLRRRLRAAMFMNVQRLREILSARSQALEVVMTLRGRNCVPVKRISFAQLNDDVSGWCSTVVEVLLHQ